MSEPFKEYKRKLRWRGSMRKHANGDWDTRETWLWMNNEEGIYNESRDLVRRGGGPEDLYNLMSQYQEMAPSFNANLRSVDWDELTQKIDEDLSEEMGSEAEEMLNPKPTYQETKGDLPPDQSPWHWQAGDVLQDRRGSQARVEAPMTNPDGYLPMTHIAPGEQHHGQPFSLHPRALIDTYGYQRAPEPEQTPQDFAHPDPWMDNEPGTLTIPSEWQ